MKKVNIAVIFAVVFALIVSSGFGLTAYGESYSIEMIIEGVYYRQTVNVDCYRMLKTSGSFYNFAVQKLSEGVDPVNLIDYLSSRTGEAYYKELEKYKVEPISARFTVDDKGRFTYSSGKNGKDFDKIEACLAFMKALDGEKVVLNTRVTRPSVTENDLKKRTELLATFSTDYSDSGSARKHNVKLSAEFINGKVLKSGEKFSFNAVVGERNAERGFKKAKVIIDGEYVDGFGGGVCQTATTLYNAVLLSGLKVERVSRHSYPARYVGYSRDAMVSSSSDLVFVNDGKYDVYVFMFADGNRLTVKIYGEKRGSYKVLSKKIGEVEYENVDTDGKVLSNLDGYELVSHGIKGIKSELYLIDQNGASAKIRRDVYKTKNAVYKKVEANE